MNALSDEGLRWHEIGVGVQGWSLLGEAPQENRGFVEWTSYVFEKPHEDWSLYIDDERLEDDAESPSCWRWKPLFFAGEVTAELVRSDGSRAGLFLLDVAPNPGKMGRDVFSQMVRELWDADPTLVIGSEPATRPIGDLGTTEDPWLAFARLRRYTPEFFRAIRLIRARPRLALRVQRESAPLHHVRRVDRRTASALVRTPAIALLLAGTQDAPPFNPNSRLDVPVVEETVDSAANRSMFALVLALRRRGSQVLDRLQREVDSERESETRTSLALRWLVRRKYLDNLISQLTVLTRQSPFSLLQRPEITAAGLTAIAADPIYSRAWSRGWRALRPGVDSSDASERLWVSPSWEIYERWCFLRLGQLLGAALPTWNWRRMKTPHRWVGTCPGRHAELRLQPKFRSHEQETNKRWSISRERVPDLVLTVSDAEAVRFIVFDAKYSSTRANVLDAMGSAHIYQDSLRMGSRRPDASLLLVPSSGGASWLEEPAFQLEHRVGIHPFSPDGHATLPDLVTQALKNLT